MLILFVVETLVSNKRIGSTQSGRGYRVTRSSLSRILTHDRENVSGSVLSTRTTLRSACLNVLLTAVDIVAIDFCTVVCLVYEENASTSNTLRHVPVSLPTPSQKENLP